MKSEKKPKMEKVLCDDGKSCKIEVEDELEEGEIINNERNTEIVKSIEQISESKILQNIHVGGDVIERDYGCQWEMEKRSQYYGKSSDFERFNNRPKRMMKRDASNLMDERKWTEGKKPKLEKLIDYSAMLRDFQNFSKKSRTVSNKHENQDFKNHFENHSYIKKNCVPKTDEKKIPSLLDMQIPVPPEFRKAATYKKRLMFPKINQKNITVLHPFGLPMAPRDPRQQHSQ